jgi:hypothetical protein
VIVDRADGDGTADTEDAGSGSRAQLPEWAGAVAVLTGAVTLTVAVNLWWIAAHRRGLPFDIDESGYLLQAARISDALRSHNLIDVARTVRGSGRAAPLLPFTAGIVRYVTGAGPTALIGVVQMFSVVLAVASYLVGRRLASRAWAVLSAVVVMTVPGVLILGREFTFAVPAAALLMAALAAQLYAADFRSLPRSLLWGGLLGLTTLARTMTLVMVAALVVAAAVRLVALRSSRHQFGVAAAGLVFGVLVAATWYTATFSTVGRYLYSSGYGGSASRYGSARSVFSEHWWTFRLVRAIDTGAFVPLTIALALCIIVCVVAVVRRRVPAGRAPGGGTTPGTAIRSWLGRDTATIVILLVIGYLSLSTTGNAGSGFEIPLIPPAVVLIVCSVHQVRQPARGVAAAACGAAAVFSLAAQSGILPGNTSTLLTAKLGRSAYVVLNSEGGLDLTARNDLGCRPVTRCFGVVPGTSDSQYLARWETAVQHAAVTVHRAAFSRGRVPVVVFAVQDPFFNTNSVALAYQVAYHAHLNESVLHVGSIARQLDRPAGGPNLVVTGNPSSVPLAARVSPIRDRRPVVAALQAAGFTTIGYLVLPDRRAMRLWWKPRGPAAPHRHA